MTLRWNNQVNVWPKLWPTQEDPRVITFQEIGFNFSERCSAQLQQNINCYQKASVLSCILLIRQNRTVNDYLQVQQFPFKITQHVYTSTHWNFTRWLGIWFKILFNGQNLLSHCNWLHSFRVVTSEVPSEKANAAKFGSLP